MSAAFNLSIYSWNVNGIQAVTQRPITSFFKTTDNKSSSASIAGQLQPASLRDFLRRHEFPTTLFLQEVKINPDDVATQKAVQSAVRAPQGSDEPDYLAYFCLPADRFNARGFGRKIYGVCSIVRADFVEATKAKVRTVDWDLEGRFQVIEAAATEHMPKLQIFNIYAVNGTDLPYKSPESGEIIGCRHDRKLEVHALLLKECKQLESDGWSVILAGDLNIARSRIDGYPSLRTFPNQHVLNRADFDDKFVEGSEGLGAVDTFRHLHPKQKGYTYYPRGGPFGYSCDRVDLILCSKRLLIDADLTSAGMLSTEAERGTSDHCPLYAIFAFPPDLVQPTSG